MQPVTTMIKKCLFLFCLFVCTATLYAQQLPLPAITVKNINNRIIVSWVNGYTKPIVNLNIQRSYDSLKNFSTIGEVLSPQSKENGYVDVSAPYNKMYYRVFIAFEGGSYIITPSARPVKDFSQGPPPAQKYPWMADPVEDAPDTGIIPRVINPKDTSAIPKDAKFPVVIRPKDTAATAIIPIKPEITYPSMRIFTARDNNIVIHLPEAATKKYTVKFYDENEKFLFELKKLKEEYLIIEKVNFVHTGWFRFEIYDNGELVEENKFQITKETRDPKKF